MQKIHQPTTCSLTEAADQIAIYQRWFNLDPSERLRLYQDTRRQLEVAQLENERLRALLAIAAPLPPEILG